MTTNTQTFTVADPRTFDGDPFEVAQRAVAQALGTAKLLEQTVAWARLMARNAEMEREILRGEDPDAAGFDVSAQGRKYDALVESLETIEEQLRLLARVAGFNPRTPLGPA